MAKKETVMSEEELVLISPRYRKLAIAGTEGKYDDHPNPDYAHALRGLANVVCLSALIGKSFEEQEESFQSSLVAYCEKYGDGLTSFLEDELEVSINESNS